MGTLPAIEAVMLKAGERHFAANPPMGFGATGLVQRVPLWGAFGW